MFHFLLNKNVSSAMKNKNLRHLPSQLIWNTYVPDRKFKCALEVYIKTNPGKYAFSMDCIIFLIVCYKFTN